MRFAGSAISNFARTPGLDSFIDPMRPDAGEQAMTADNIRRDMSTAGTELMGRTAAKGISAAGEVEAAEILGDAGAALAQAQGNAAIMEGIGSIGSSLVGSIGKFNYAGGPGSVGTKMGAGGGNVGGYGTLGPNYGIWQG